MEQCQPYIHCDWCPYKKRRDTDADRRTGRKPRKNGAEVGGMYLLAEGRQGFLTTAGSGRGQEGSPV